PVAMVSYCEWVALVRRMIPLNMLTFTTAPKIVNGVFAVPKGPNSQRLIADLRPANSQMIPSPHVDLPRPDLLARLVPLDSGPLYVGKVDLDNFYHRIRIPGWLQPWFALPSVRAGDVGLGEQYGPETLVYPCCATLPMGWSHSVYVAQASHE